MDRLIPRQIDRQIDWQRYVHTFIQTERQTDGGTDIHTYNQIDRQAFGQTERKRQGQRLDRPFKNQDRKDKNKMTQITFFKLPKTSPKSVNSFSFSFICPYSISFFLLSPCSLSTRYPLDKTSEKASSSVQRPEPITSWRGTINISFNEPELIRKWLRAVHLFGDNKSSSLIYF